MSYFKDCSTFAQHFTADQITPMRTALESGNRRPLISTQLGDTQTPHLRYGALWHAGTQPQVWWELCTQDQMRQKTAELWATMRLQQLRGFQLDGNVYFACLWEPGTFGQVWWPNCSEQDFRNKTSELWATMRPAQLAPFSLDRQVRYSALWTDSTAPQIWWPACTREQLRQLTGDVWDSMRPQSWFPFTV